MAKLLVNGMFYDGKEIDRGLGWALVEEGRFKGIGSMSEVPSEGFEEIIDLEGRMVLPGLHDAHIHVMYLGQSMFALDLHGVGSIDEFKERLSAYVTANPSLCWIYGFGWDQELLGTYPSKDMIDAIVPEKPVVLSRCCFHVGVCNSFALQLIGVSESIESELVDRVEGSDEPSGILREEQWDILVSRMNKDVDDATKLVFLRTGLKACKEKGLTAVQSNDRGSWHLYKQLVDLGELDMRVFLTIDYAETLSDSALLPKAGQAYGPLLHCDRVKMFQDGSLGGETAALSEPYTSSPGNRGTLFHSVEKLCGMLQDAKQKGFRVELHVIGDLALETGIEAAERAHYTKEDRLVLTHCQIMRPDLMDRMARLGVIANIQPQFYLSDYEGAMVRLGAERMKYCYCWKMLMDHGVLCAGGSDAPVEDCSPFEGISAAVFRRCTRWEDRSTDSQCLSMEQSIALYTTKAAYGAKRENSIGQLREGFDADFVVCDDFLDEKGIPLFSLKDVKPLQVWVGGNRVY